MYISELEYSWNSFLHKLPIGFWRSLYKCYNNITSKDKRNKHFIFIPSVQTYWTIYTN